MRQAPVAYIADYYEKRIARRRQYPEVLGFYEHHLRSVAGEHILNIGCGPQFYDDLRRFGGIPRAYIGIDLNQATIDFLATSNHPEVIAGKAHAFLHGVAAKLICADIFHVEFAPESFDNVISIGFLGIFGEEPFIRAIARVRSWLRPGGMLLNM
ncbi:MAG: class I SAM-dependent methyltransferase, partial [Hyphomicrobiaceae bacterium]